MTVPIARESLQAPLLLYACCCCNAVVRLCTAAAVNGAAVEIERKLLGYLKNKKNAQSCEYWLLRNQLAEARQVLKSNPENPVPSESAVKKIENCVQLYVSNHDHQLGQKALHGRCANVL